MKSMSECVLLPRLVGLGRMVAVDRRSRTVGIVHLGVALGLGSLAVTLVTVIAIRALGWLVVCCVGFVRHAVVFPLASCVRRRRRRAGAGVRNLLTLGSCHLDPMREMRTSESP